MDIVIWLTLFSIFSLYFFVAFIPVRICAICTSVSITWGVLLLTYFLGYHNQIILIAMLMGGSVIGVMYRLEEYCRKNKLRNFWFVRIWWILGGFLGIMLLLEVKWRELSLLVVIMIILSFISIFLLQSSTIAKSKKRNKLAEKLEHCCD